MKAGRITCVFAIILLNLAAYWNSLASPFIFDDLISITDNRSIRRLWPLTVPLSPPHRGYTVEGRPIVNLSLALNYAIHGYEVQGYHLFNVTVHIISAMVLFDLARRTLKLPRSPAAMRRQATGLAVVIALVWSLHPIQTTAVTYTIQRAESLMAMFYLLTLYFSLLAATAGRGWAVAAVLSAAAGMACKEVMVSAPIMVILYDRLFLYDDWLTSIRSRWKLYASLLSTWLLLAWFIAGSLGRGGTVGFGEGVSPAHYLLTQFCMISEYLGAVFFLRPVVFDYGTDVITDAARISPCAAIVLIPAAVTLLAMRYYPRFGFTGVVFFAVLSPSSSFIPVVTQMGSLHRMYLPLAALVCAVVPVVWWGWRAVRHRLVGRRGSGGQLFRAASAILTLAVCAALLIATIDRNRDFRSAVSIWEDTLRKRPENARAALSLSVHYYRQGEDNRAMESINRAIAAKPDYAQALSQRAVIYMRLGRDELALQDFNRALELHPGELTALANRGIIYYHRQAYEQAIADYSHAIDLKHDHVDAIKNRGLAWMKLDDDTSATNDFNLAIQLEPGRGELYHLRGKARAGLSDYHGAIDDFSEAIRLGPDNAALYTLRGVSYQKINRHREAVQDFIAANELDPDNAELYRHRAVSLYTIDLCYEAMTDLAFYEQLGGEPEPDLFDAVRDCLGRDR